MPGEKHGEYISLYFDANNHPEFIRGWVEKENAQKEIRSQLEGVTVVDIKHTYAFWGRGLDDVGDFMSVLMVRDTPGRGRFKVTQCRVSKDN